MFPDKDDNIEIEIDKAIEELVELGYIDVVGINEQGQWLYKATDKGRDFYMATMETGIIDQISRLFDDE